MRRGMGITDIMLYVFVLFLVIVAMAISVFASASKSNVSVIKITADVSERLVAESIGVRSASELMSATPISATVPEFQAFEIRQYEFIGFASTYVHTDAAREDADVLESPWFDPVLRNGPFAVQLYRIERSGPDEPITEQVYERDFGFRLPGVVPDRSFGPAEADSATRVLWIWVPGYIGATPLTTGTYTLLGVPVGVNIDES